ncbi:helix-turn-helix domain-containing protein [Bathymodiolus japonicus methanotrophic gill symbiont]|uniref:helix-turn-helix domain-containing protein n=1 Tax=Bathymodiolus japonicus methanotrophic gill symbiont TaxID=113269 RepID=UPI001C8E1A70|nr:helix-turn-helix domain-containing protein [Bathymodiolus japonicus methanotrophic gill symbiont]
MVSLTFSKSIVDRLKKNMATALKLSNIRLYRLTQALLWFSECMGIKEIARLMGVCEKTIINWLKTFMHKGVGWLIGQHYQGRGRKSKLTKDQKNKLMEKAVEEKSVVLFGDEVSFAMWGSLARTWAPIGEQPTVKTSGIRKGLKMFGTIELEGGSFQYRESLAYEIKPKSLRLLKEAGLPQEFLAILKSLKSGSRYFCESLFWASQPKQAAKT